MFEWVRKLLGRGKAPGHQDTGQSEPERAEPEHIPPSPPAPPRPRDFHLGLDWGTSTTKLVLRDYAQGDQGLAYVLSFDGAEGGYRYSSAVAVDDGRIYLGPEAEDRGGALYSLKALAIGGRISDFAPGSSKLSYEDLAALYLAHVLNRAWGAAREVAARVGAPARLGVTLGVPTEVSWSRFPRTDLYLRMVRTAFQLGVRGTFDPQGLSEGEVLSALRAARADVTGSADFDTWLRPELAAATLWAFRTPSTEAGLYSCVDVGAWTTNASFFRIRQEGVGEDYLEVGGLTFYGGACRPPAMNQVCALLAQREGLPAERLRGSENDTLRRFGRQVAEPALTGIFDTWRLGFHNSYGKEGQQAPWRNLRVLAVGGGSKVETVRELLTRFPLQGWDPPRLEPDLGCPRDLFHLPRTGSSSREAFSGDSAFLLVAYGLSVRSGEFPPMRLADEIQPLPPVNGGGEKKPRRVKCTCHGYDECPRCWGAGWYTVETRREG